MDCQPPEPDPDRISREKIEIQLLLEGIFLWYGYDFRSYAPSSIRRRIWKRIQAESLDTVSGLQERVLHDPKAMSRLLQDLSVTVSGFFRNPGVFRAIRNQVVPVLRTCPFIRIWHAGCATGEEVYSMAILLHEEGLYDRCRIYATDFNATALESARAGIFPLNRMKDNTENYIRSGGKAAFSEYYTADAGHVIFRSFLKDNILFSLHNLVTDTSFNAFNLIFCRNVMIYFNRELQAHTHTLLYKSLDLPGFLCLGDGENLKFTPYEDRYQALAQKEKIFRRTA